MKPTSCARRDGVIGLEIAPQRHTAQQNTTAEANGLGLHGMGERVALLGGVLSIDSAPGQGTILRTRFPIHATAPSEQG